VTATDIVAFERYLETTPDPRTGKLRHPNTILGYLSSFKGVFTVAVQQILLDASPMDKVTIGSKVDSKRQSYSVAQVTLILNSAVAGPMTFSCRSWCKRTPVAGSRKSWIAPRSISTSYTMATRRR
jgi:hypothetical protein